MSGTGKAQPPPSPRRTGRATVRMALPARPPPIDFSGDPRPDAQVQYYATLHGTDSYANVAHAIGRALAERLEKLSICSYVGGRIDDPALAPHRGLNRRAPVGIFLGLPHHVPETFYEHVLRIGVFVCEADRVLPQWVSLCNRLHLVVVPSRYCRDAFVLSGVRTPVMVVPHGLHPEHAPLRDRRPADRFVFYNTFRSQAADRKGYRELLRCFQAAFEGRDDVVLRLRVGDPAWLPRPAGWPDYGGLVEFDPPDPLTMVEAAEVYSAVHCTVHPSKAEGFGLVPLESIASETPVIAPAHTGMLDYLDEANAVLLPPGELIRAPRTEIQCGRWFDVDEERLVESLRRVVEHWSAERDKVGAAAAEIRQRYAWPKVLRPFVELVEAALDCGDSWELSRLTEAWRDPGMVERGRREAERLARTRPVTATSPGAPDFRFPSVIYCGWDYPRDGVGNHLRLLDGLIFNGPGIRYKSLDELQGSYDPELYPQVASYVHEQRPDLFRDGLYLDLVGFHGDEAVIRRQIDRVADVKRRFNARTAIYLMWESDRLWAPVLELVNAYDLTIVTSSLLEEYLRERGVRYARLPHPYKYEIDQPSQDASVPEPLTLGISAGLWPRKNLAAATELFAEALGDDARFRFRVHTRTEGRGEAREEHERIERVAQRVDNVEYVVRAFSRGDYLDWMKSLDVYCFVSSGEGWSVTPREALHLGKPVVLLDAHVHADFSHLPGVIPVAPGPPRPARPGARFVQSGIGREASLAPEAFKDVLSELPASYSAARSALARRFDEVVAFHALEAVRNQWVEALNDIFD